MNDLELLQQSHRADELIFKGLVEFGSLKAALELDLFTHLAGEAKDTETVATAVGAIPQRLIMLLEALAQIGVTAKEDGTWSLTPFAKRLFVPEPFECFIV